MQDVINHPAHYTGIRINGNPVECIEVIEALDLPPHLANALKYIWRHKRKNGLEDIRKAAWYLNRYCDWKAAQTPAQPTDHADHAPALRESELD